MSTEILFWGNHAHVAHCVEGCKGEKCDCSCHWPSAEERQPAREQQICEHQFVWPNDDCVLATTMPGHTEPMHVMVARKFEPLFRHFSAQTEAARELLSECKTAVYVLRREHEDNAARHLEAAAAKLRAAMEEK